MDGALGRFLAARSKQRANYRILGWFENGFRQISNRLRPCTRRPISKACASACCRARSRRSTFELLGAVPLRMDLTEAIDRIKAGTLDAQENPFANTVTYGVHKFHRFHTVTNHFYISRPIFLHRAAFDAWPADLQRAMREAIDARRRVPARARDRGGRRARAAILAEGCEITELTAAEHAQFRAAVTPLLDEARGTYGQDVRDGLAALLVGLGQDQRPEHLVLRLRRIDRGDAHAGHALLSILARCGGESRQPENASASVW